MEIIKLVSLHVMVHVMAVAIIHAEIHVQRLAIIHVKPLAKTVDWESL